MNNKEVQVMLLSLLLVAVVVQLQHVDAHGMVLDPVCRQSRWRYNRTAPADYNDNQVFCGGFWVQFGQNGGQCGVCGDNWTQKQPRAHELGGRYGEGVIVATYKAGAVLPVRVQITSNHRGKFVFNLCALDGANNSSSSSSAETAACFERNALRLANGGAAEFVLPTAKPGMFDVRLRLPEGLRCEHCVLQWTYVAGNNWGVCASGKGEVGCGPQEHFRACSDIRIV